jgi:hypothetical protein
MESSTKPNGAATNSTPHRASPYDTAHEAEQNLMCEKARALIDELPLAQRTVLEMT